MANRSTHPADPRVTKRVIEFIEALAGDKSLQISKDQLEGFTQSVSAYVVESIRPTITVFDTPGFLDSRLSDMEIILMIKEWVLQNGTEGGSTTAADVVLYFTPVTDTRLPASKKHVLDIFKDLTGSNTADRVTIVTTMWDTVWSEQSKQRAESNFDELSTRVWEDFIDEGADITKFFNTQHSAFSVIDKALARGSPNNFALERMIKNEQPMLETPFGASAYQDLINRIEGLRMQKSTIERDLQEESTQNDPALLDVLDSQLGRVEHDLHRFEDQLAFFDMLPPPRESYPSESSRSIVGSDTEMDEEVPGPIARGLAALKRASKNIFSKGHRDAVSR
ncbi:hypothetical protein BJ165DRAFT_1609375 [Panaeolus papilionaceus]|nr:hypothetical protein BJ165DRAFT_1609375 [Panaeolus papilionaceus]